MTQARNVLLSERAAGPEVFLQRLRDIQQFPSNIMLCNATVDAVRTAKKSPEKTVVARLDGTNYYDFTGRNLYNFLKQRKEHLLPYCRWLSDIEHSSTMATRLVNRYLSRCASWMLKNAQGIVFQSELSRTMYVRFLGYKEFALPERIIHNGVSLAEFVPDHQAKKLGGFPAVIIAASIFRPHKRLQDAVRLVNRLSARYKDIRLHVLGRLDSLTEMELQRNDLARCVFHGQVPPVELPEYYQRADVMLSLCIFDACPNVVCEGLASGLPVITPRESGASELVGCSNSSWVVRENLSLGYYELQTVEALPRVPELEYAECFARVVEDLPAQKERARQRAVATLDIRTVARRYLEFIEVIGNERRQATAG